MGHPVEFNRAANLLIYFVKIIIFEFLLVILDMRLLKTDRCRGSEKIALM